ncbi:hypothetical protein QE390_002013 [Siphonobacter sp. SORGH_AS 1065]|nr:hypothetical protein [Siphonobacter sp. SORGH_AS_1065]
MVGVLTNHYALYEWLVKTPAMAGDWRMVPSNVYPGLNPPTLSRICNPKALCKGFIIPKVTLTAFYPDAIKSRLYLK